MAPYQSLYRRYRPQRFDQVLGQGPITGALRNAVRDGRVGHAYLFSGPRGTGKTSTARILAKVLNCAAPSEGEPCEECESCVAVAEGRVVDWLLEQDAASKSKVDDMRDLLERVPLGTSGSRKVIILDEVHMLSQGAENALLKTLEEPPDHVVFVLATTDPQKVRPTIRSRTQHFAFRLLGPDVLADYVRYVIDDAGLDLGDEVVDHVVRIGAGSARDTLSALDQVAALGEVLDDAQPVDAVVDALCERDAGAALVAVAQALAAGREPRALGEALIANLRDAFLALMGAGEAHLPADDRPRAAQVGERLGAAGITRALDVVGEALTELARKPDPRVVLEVALVRLMRPDTDRSLDAILERLDRLERGGAGPAAGAPPAEQAGARPQAEPSPDTERASGPPPAKPPAGSPASAKAALADAGGQAPAAPPDAGPTDVGPQDAGPPRAAASKPTLGAVARQRSASGQAAGSRRGSLAGGGSDADSGPSTVAEAGTSSAASASGGGTSASTGSKAGTATSPDATGASGGGTSASTGSRAGTASSPDAAGADTGASAGSGQRVATQEDDAATGERDAQDLGRDELVAAWDGQVLSALAIPVRSKWRGGRWLEPAGATARFAVPNEWHQRACQATQRDVEAALSRHLGRPVSVAVVVDEAGTATSGGGSGDPSPGGNVPPQPPDPAPDDEHVDLSELRDADDVAAGGVDLLMRELGGKLVEEDAHE